MNHPKPGDVVIVASGPHFLRHGLVKPGIRSELNEQGLAAAPAGFAFVQFMNGGGKLQRRETEDGAPVDLVNVQRLRLALTVQQMEQTTDMIEAEGVKKREARAAAEAFARRCIVEVNSAAG